jgi:hypothetical protein
LFARDITLTRDNVLVITKVINVLHGDNRQRAWYTDANFHQTSVSGLNFFFPFDYKKVFCVHDLSWEGPDLPKAASGVTLMKSPL